MTSLSLQLKRLALPQTDPNLFSRKEVASLLFDPTDAATMDRSTFYALGCTGLEELLGIEPALGEFQQTLFSPASLTLERSVQSKEVNLKLDSGISLFLTRLCPYFMLRPAHKCLEWLIHRFHIHLYNTNSLLACALPYHDTKVFVRVVQLLRIKEPTHRWNWLHPLQNPGVPLSRLTLVTHCRRDLWFLDFVCSLVTDSIEAYSGHSAGGSELRVIFSFYASIIVSVLDSAETVTNDIIAKLLPYVQKGLKSLRPDFRASSFMILCQLSVKVVMETGLVQSLSGLIAKSLKDRVLVQEGLGSLIVLLQNQDHSSPSARALTRLSSLPELVSSLQFMAVTHDVSPLLRPLLLHLLHCTFTSSGESEVDSGELLENLLKSVPLTKDLDKTLARSLLDEYLSQTHVSDGDLSVLNQRLLPVIRVLESKYSSALDAVLSSHVTDLSSDQHKRLFHQFLSLSVTSGKFQMVGDSDTSLVLSLNHPQATVRVLALDRLRDIVSSGQGQTLEQDFLKDSVMERLKDDEPNVVSSALGLMELLLDVLDPEETVSSLLSLLNRAAEAEQWWPIVSTAVRLLSNPHLGKSDADLSQRLGWRLLPFLVFTTRDTDSTRFKLASTLSQSCVVEQLPLTSGWSSDLDSVMKTGSDLDLVSLLNQTLISTLTRNLRSMETFCRRHALESLCSFVELLSESGSGPNQRTSLLVLVQTLVLGLRDLSDSQHLLTARRVYRILERHLQETHRESIQSPSMNLPALSPTSFSDWLAFYLLRCEQSPGSGLDSEFSVVLVSVLAQFISELKCPDQNFKGDLWWNPERLDGNTCCYLSLLCQVFSLLMGGASHGPITGHYRELIKLLVKVHLSDPLTLFRFLSLVWGLSGNHGDHVEVRLGPVLRTQALFMGSALMDQRPDSLQELDLSIPVFPSLLVVLCSPFREVRRAGLSALRSLLAASSSAFQPITERLLKNSEEILADHSYVGSALGALFSGTSSSKPGSRTDPDRLRASVLKLLDCVASPSCPSYTASALLRVLGQVNGQEVLLSLLPAVERLLDQMGPDTPSLLQGEAQLLALLLGKYSPEAAPLMAKESRCRELFLRAMKTSQRQSEAPSLQLTALDQISKGFFSALGDEQVQQSILSAMLDVLVESGSSQAAHSVSSVFKAISLDAQLVANELSPPEKPTVAVSVQQTRRSKMLQSRRAQDEAAQPEGGAVSWHRVTLILELLQHKKKLKRAQALVPVLFNLLSRRLEPSSEEQASVEYTKQLLLSCLLSVCNKLSPDGQPIPTEVLEPERFSVELVVQCIRSSEMAQTHHQALLLLSAVASIFPEKVLLNIMPIFTFMGANIMRLDDAYSFRVIDKTVQMVIPALIKAQDSSGEDSAQVHAVVTRIVHVFVDALPHVPEHRRVPILNQLLTTTGPDRFLWVLLALLFRQHCTSSGTNKDLVLERDVDLWISVCCEFKVEVQLRSLVQILVFLQQLPHDKQDAPAKRPIGRRVMKKTKAEEEKMEDLVFSVEAHSGKELRHFKYLCVSFSAQLLCSDRFIGKVSELEDCAAADQTLQQLQQKLLEEILRYVHSVSHCVEENSDNPTAKYWRVLLNKSYDLLDKVNALLPTDSFITVTRGLMGNQLSNVRRKAMELLNNKLQQKTTWDQTQVSSLLLLVSDLQRIVEDIAEPAVNRQTALFSLKLLCRLFGSSDRQAFVVVLRAAVGVVTATDEDRNVMASALLCVAEAVTALKALAIPQLPRLMPAVLSALSDRKDCLSSEIYLMSSVTALHHVTETLPNFISPYLQDVTAQVCRLSRLSEISSGSSWTQLSLRLKSLRSTLASKVPSRVLLPTVSRCYGHLVSDQKNQLVALMSILKEHIGHMDRDQLTLHQSELTSFFLTALDFRSEHCQEDLEKAERIEGSVIDCLLSMVLKLSEVTFRPLFFKLVEWSKVEASGSKERLLTFLRLADSIAQKLKGLFVLFAGNLVKPFADLLRQTQSCTDGLFPSGHGPEKTSLLLQLLLDCLQKVFLYDTQRFLSRERADTLMGPLVEQLENLQGGQEVYRRRVTHSLVPCLGQFSVALADDTQWKSLNYSVLLQTRHSSSQVRLSALQVLLELASKLKENYMVLLPETIPFLAELMEDECEEVEQQVQRVVQEMENILGEPLQSYF